jgi:hypothetical protein
MERLGTAVARLTPGEITDEGGQGNRGGWEPDHEDGPGRPMTGDRVVRSTASPERPTFLELLADLVYVFALTRISQRLVSDISAEHRLPFANAGGDPFRSRGNCP